MTRLLSTLALGASLVAIPATAAAGDCNYKTTAQAPALTKMASADGDFVTPVGSYAKKDIVDTAAGNDMFSTLVAAVQAAGLVDTLKSDGPFTVFAPTNEAFAALPAGTVDSLLLPENRDRLVSVLTYHVVPAKVMSTDLSDGADAPTVQGETLRVDLSNGVRINGANVVKADIKTANGVIHVIDTVMLPPALMN